MRRLASVQRAVAPVLVLRRARADRRRLPAALEAFDSRMSPFRNRRRFRRIRGRRCYAAGVFCRRSDVDVRGGVVAGTVVTATGPSTALQQGAFRGVVSAACVRFVVARSRLERAWRYPDRGSLSRQMCCIDRERTQIRRDEDPRMGSHPKRRNTGATPFKRSSAGDLVLANS